MTFKIKALDYWRFSKLFTLSDAELAQHSACRVIADTKSGYPCRVSLEDAEIGETLILTNYQHLSGLSPYAASHAIYIRQNARTVDLRVGEVPETFSQRLLSLRGFDKQGMMHQADVIAGSVLSAHLDHFFTNPEIAFIDIHNAKPGCFAARAERV